MTTTSKSSHVRDVAVSTGGTAVKAAKLYWAGPASLAFQLAKRGYGITREKSDGRKSDGAVVSSVSSTPRKSTRGRKFLVFGTLLGAAAGIAVAASKRRNTFVPPAEAPPRLEDYQDQTSPVNGSSAHTAEK